MKLTVSQLKRIIKEAVSIEKRAAYNQRRLKRIIKEGLKIPRERQEAIADFLADAYYDFKQIGKKNNINWEELMSYARQKEKDFKRDEIEKSFKFSPELDFVRQTTKMDTNGFTFLDDPQEAIANFIKDAYYDFKQIGKKNNINWEELMSYARKKGVKAKREEIEKVFKFSPELDTYRYFMNIDGTNGITFSDVDPYEV